MKKLVALMASTILLACGGIAYRRHTEEELRRAHTKPPTINDLEARAAVSIQLLASKAKSADLVDRVNALAALDRLSVATLEASTVDGAPS